MSTKLSEIIGKEIPLNAGNVGLVSFKELNSVLDCYKDFKTEVLRFILVDLECNKIKDQLIIAQHNSNTCSTSYEELKIVNSRLEEKNLYLIIAHNHPSGNTAPSNEDICFTSKIEAFFRSTNRFLGHIIISPNKDVFSYYTKRTKWGKYGKDESSFYVKSVKKNKKIIRSTWRRKIN